MLVPSMKPQYIAAIAAATSVVTTLLLIPQVAATTVTYIATSTPPVVEHIVDVNKMVGTADQEAWLKRLEMCESTGNPNAINPNDLDNTPSYGLLQFKPSTFAAFSKAYGIKGELMDPDAQRAIVRRMMRDKSVNWHQQFPACVRALGLPPLM